MNERIAGAPACARSWRSRTAASGSFNSTVGWQRVSGPAPSSGIPQNQSVLEADLKRITYANKETSYTIARVATERTTPDI